MIARKKIIDKIFAYKEKVINLENEKLENEKLEEENKIAINFIINEIYKFKQKEKQFESKVKKDYLKKEKNKLEILKNQKIKINNYYKKLSDDKKLKMEKANKSMIRILKNKIREFENRDKRKKSLENFNDQLHVNKSKELINYLNKNLIEEKNRIKIEEANICIIKILENKIKEFKIRDKTKKYIENLKKENELRNRIEINILEKEKSLDIKFNINKSKKIINNFKDFINIKNYENKILEFKKKKALKSIKKFIRLFLIKIKNKKNFFCQPRILLIYNYKATKNKQNNLRNLSFFIKYGLNRNLWRELNIIILFIINGEYPVSIIPNREDLFIWKNNNIDNMDSYKEGINFLEKKLNNKVYNLFNYLFLLNDQTFGPIMNENIKNHWIDPYLNKINDDNSIICFPNKENKFNYFPMFSCFCCLIKMNFQIYKILLNDEIFKNLLKKYNNRCNYLLEISEDFFDRQIFINNNLIINEDTRNDYPIKYQECKEFYNKKLNLKEIEYNNLPLNYKDLAINKNIYLKNYNKCELITSSKIQSYNIFGNSEDYIIWNVLPTNNSSILIYNHLSKQKYLDDYILITLHCLINLKYDIIFNTISSSINNVDLPFEINYYENDKENINNYMNYESIKKISNKYEWILLINSDILLPIHNFNNMKLSIEKLRKNNDYYGLYGNNNTLFDGFIEYKNKCIKTLLDIYKANSCNQNINHKFKILNKFKSDYVINIENLKNISNDLFLDNKDCFGIFCQDINYYYFNKKEINFICKFI